MGKITPMMEQYLRIKSEYKNCLVFFRLGDFYELFFDDALIASKELEITLTGKDYGQEERAPMCGVPYHAADSYIARLVQKGYKVAVCEQTENPKLTKTIVKREVIRVITPGTVLDNTILDEGKNNYILSIYEGSSSFGISACDVSTGEFFVSSIKKDDYKLLLDEIARYNPSEIIINNSFQYSLHIENIFAVKPSLFNEWCYEFSNAYIALCNHFKVINLIGYGLEDKKEMVAASGALLIYLSETQKNNLAHISLIRICSGSQYMALDISSRRNLELTENMREREKKGSLLWVLDRTKTAMGARTLRKWLEQPLMREEEIIQRLDAVEEFKNDVLFREEMKECLNTIYDIERIMSKIIYATANAKDLVNLRNSIAVFPVLYGMLSQCKTELNKSLRDDFDVLEDIFSAIDAAICDEPPFSIREGGFIKSGYNAELDTYYTAKNEGTAWLLDMENKEKEATGIKNLKIRFNRVFGYYIEITNSNKNQVPDHFIRRQTLANCERYTTEALKEIEDAILGADEKITALEFELFNQLRTRISGEVERIQKGAGIIATMDCLQSLADTADAYKYVKPVVDDSGVIDIIEGRHPVIERMGKFAFVPNNTYLDTDDNRLSIITGPNMAGKSTYMRQTAIIVLMAQIGSFVPADQAHIGVVDRIFTRVGASDDLATGQSTFMVEMSEVANILNNATSKSLLILDEIGRGTSTFDGLSIAWAVMEYIADKGIIGSKTLFATHYHELTELEGKVQGVKNYCITVAQQGEEIIFLRKIVRGGAEASYGVYVAKLAGIPEKIISRSNEILEALNSADIAKRTKNTDSSEVYYPVKKRDNDRHKIVIKELLGMDIDSLTPREALRALYDLKTRTIEIEKS